MFKCRLLASAVILSTMVPGLVRASSMLEFRDVGECLIRVHKRKTLTPAKPGKTPSERLQVSLPEGAVSQQLGYVQLLRFSGVKQGFYPDGARNYQCDEGVDPVTTCVRQLFPSHAGTLNTGTQAAYCFANLFNQNPERLASLTRALDQVLSDETIDAKEFLVSLKIVPRKEGLDPFMEFEDRGGQKITLLKKAEDFFKNAKIYALHAKDLDVFYGRHALQRVFNTFLYLNLGTRESAKDYLMSLDPTFVDKKALCAWHPQGWHRKDYKELARHDILSDDDILSLFALERGATPYASFRPINGASATVYDRVTKVSLRKTFPDCMETTLRHLLSTVLYDLEQDNWHLEGLEALHKARLGHPEDPLANLIKFYKTFPVTLANTGDSFWREQWNGVVGDLNCLDVLGIKTHAPEISYRGKDKRNKKSIGYNTMAGWDNVAFMMWRLTGIEPETTFPFEDPNDLVDARSKWMRGYLLKVFKAISPHKDLDASFSKGFCDHQDKLQDKYPMLYGTMQISNPELWSLGVCAKPGHAEISFIKDEWRREESLEEDEVFERYLKQDHIDPFIAHMVRQRLGIDTSMTSEDMGLLFKLYDGAYMQDNTRNLRIISAMNDQLTPDTSDAFKPFMISLLQDLSWDDAHVRNHFNKIVFNPIFLKTYHPYLKCLGQPRMDKASDWNISGFSHVDDGTLVFEPNETLQELNFRHSGFQTLDATRLFCIEDLSVQDKTITRLIVGPDNKKLSKITLTSSSVEVIEGLHNLVGLREFGKSPPKLKKLTFGPVNEALQKINLTKSSVEVIEGLDKLKNLEIFDAQDTKHLMGLTFGPDNINLREIHVQNSSLQKIEGLDKLRQLKEFNAQDTKSLIDLTFGPDNEMLSRLSISYSRVPIIRGLDKLGHLSMLSAHYMEGLEKLTFGPSNIKMTDLRLSSLPHLQSIDGLDFLDQLWKLDVLHTPVLKGLKFGPKNSTIKSLDMTGSGIERIEGGKYLTNLESIYFEQVIQGSEDLKRKKN